MKKSSKSGKKKTAPVKKAKPDKKKQGNLLDSPKTQASAPVAAAEPLKKSRGGLRDVNEADADTVEIVRGEFLADTFMAKITLAFKTATFNTACVNLFPGCQHILFRIDKKNRRLIVEPTNEYSHIRWKFANFKSGRNVPRTGTTKHLCPWLFEFMKWDPNAKYRILAIYQEFGNRKLLVFNLDDCLEVYSETVELENGKKRRNSTIHYPEEWKGRFGFTKSELAKKMQIDFGSTVITIDPQTGETSEKQIDDIDPKPPIPEDLILQQYGSIRPRKEKPTVEEE